MIPAGTIAGRLLEHLSRAGPRSSSDLLRALGLSSSTLNRAVRDLGSAVLRVGRARATRYAARRTVHGVLTPMPVYEVDADGEPRHRLTLHPVEPLGYWVESHDESVGEGFFEVDPRDPGPDSAVDLPWFLLDLKPQGYLGRTWLAAHPGEGFPSRLTQWSGDDVLRYAAVHGVWLPGAWLLGNTARNTFMHTRTEGPGIDPGPALVEEAERTAANGPRGSSPGGEQPKFTVRTTDGRHWLTKFTAPVDQPAGRRWADLLVLEHIAHQVLAEEGFESCETHIVDAGGRRFLMVKRFDRHGERGRSGLVSLFALDRDGVADEHRQWSLATHRLVEQGRVDPADHASVQWLEAFGVAIANTDMHTGNLSFRLRGTTLAGLAPVYDMLPMAFRPHPSGEVRSDPFFPWSVRDDLPDSAVAAAVRLWNLGARDPRVSEPFRAICRDQAERLKR